LNDEYVVITGWFTEMDLSNAEAIQSPIKLASVVPPVTKPKYLGPFVLANPGRTPSLIKDIVSSTPRPTEGKLSRIDGRFSGE
jgi:hypothetical protein